MLPCTPPPSSFLGSIPTPPRPRLERDPPFPACVPDEPRTRTAPQPAHARSIFLACRRPNTLAAATHARTPRGPRPRPPLPTGGWRARVHPPACTCPSQAGEQRACNELDGFFSDSDGVTERALKAAARSGLRAGALASGRGAFSTYSRHKPEGPLWHDSALNSQPRRGWRRVSARF